MKPNAFRKHVFPCSELNFLLLWGIIWLQQDHFNKLQLISCIPVLYISSMQQFITRANDTLLLLLEIVVQFQSPNNVIYILDQLMKFSFCGCNGSSLLNSQLERRNMNGDILTRRLKLLYNFWIDEDTIFTLITFVIGQYPRLCNIKGKSTVYNNRSGGFEALLS